MDKICLNQIPRCLNNIELGTMTLDMKYTQQPQLIREGQQMNLFTCATCAAPTTLNIAPAYRPLMFCSQKCKDAYDKGVAQEIQPHLRDNAIKEVQHVVLAQ